MATIAKYVADMEVDPTGVKRGVDRATGYVREFSKTANSVLTPRTVPKNSFFDSIEKSVEATLPKLDQLPPAHERAGHAAVEHHLSINRLEKTLEAFAARATGTNEVLAVMGAAFLNFGAGHVYALAILIGIGLVVAAWEVLTKQVREAKKAMDEFAKTDDAFRARSAAGARTLAQLSILPGNRADALDPVVGATKGIDDARLAVEGYRHELEKTAQFWTIGGKADASKMLEKLRHEYVEGKIDVTKFGVELAKVELKHPDWSRAIASTADLVAEYDAARKSLALLTAAEEHRLAIENQHIAAGPLGFELSRNLEDARRKLDAFARGGEPAVRAIENEISAVETGTKAWDEYVVTQKGASLAHLTFTDALRAHNPVAEQTYQAALKLAEANRQLNDAMGQSPLEKMTERLLRWRAAAEKAGELTSVFSSKIADAISDAEQALAKQTDKLSDTALRLRETLAKLVEAFAVVQTLPQLSLLPSAGVGAFTRPDQNDHIGGLPTEFAARTSLLRGGTASTVGLGGLPGGPGFTLPAPRVKPIPIDPLSFEQARVNAALHQLAEGAKAAASGLFDVVKSGFVGLVKNVVSQLSPFALIAKSLSEAMLPLTPVLQKIAKVVGDTLGPIFVALAPIVEAFIPFFRALLQIIAPLVRALLPILLAFVPILEALFPIIKFVAIAFTYVVQAASEVAAILLRMAGNVVVVFGIILKGLATAIDKLPFVSAKGAINAAQGLIDFGHGLLDASDDFKKTANAMNDARKEINGVNIDHTAVAITDLGDAASKTAAALTNVPAWFKIASARFNAADPRRLTPPPPHPIGVREWPKFGIAGGGGEGGGGGSTGGGGGGNGGVQISGDVYVDARTASASELFDAILDEGRKRARAQFGNADKWSEVQQ